MSYQLAVNNTPTISNSYSPGLRALGAYSVYVSVANTSELDGSVDLDSCLQASQPNANRWDYTFGYCNRSYYLEVHPASTGEVETVLRKFSWLKNWLAKDGSLLNALNAPNPFHWIASGKVSIPSGSTYQRRLSSAGLAIPKKRLSL